MAEIVESSNMNNTSPSENAVYIKKEYIDDNHVDEKVFVCETVEINCNGLEDYVNEDRIIHEVVTVDNIKTIINGNVKVEDEISLAHDIKNELNNQELFCSQCCRDYQDYCIKCGMLIYILNRNVLSNTYNDARQEIPKNILEIRESFGHFGMFTLKVIPEGVKFGPFTGLSDTEDSWKIKGGKFMVDNDKLEFLNWMQFINSAKTIFEQNLLIYQCGNDLYYRSSREIQIGEELLVYFGEKYEDSVNTEVEMDFIPDIDNDDRNVFACTFCCLGFSSEEYLFKHKTICPNLFNEKPLLEVLDLMQCLFCEIFLEKVEYLEHPTFDTIILIISTALTTKQFLII